MAATVRINGRTVVHGKSEGISIAFPDVCKTPGAGEVPYTNVAYSTEAANTSATVYADGESVMLKDSYFARSVGDEAGTDGGVISGTFNGRASFTNYSFDVMIESRNVCRLGDPMIHNHESPPNATSPAEVQPDVDTTKNMLCAIVCSCNFPGGYTKCVREQLATQRWRSPPPELRRYWDPKMPGIYVEVPFDMSQDPPRAIMDSEERSNNPLMRDRNDPEQGVRLPGGDIPPIPGSRRPDIVVVKNPDLPVDVPGNIDRIYEVKYDHDEWRPGQEEAYDKVARGRVEELTPTKCGCPDKVSDPVPVPVPMPAREYASRRAKKRKATASGGAPLSVPAMVGLTLLLIMFGGIALLAA